MAWRATEEDAPQPGAVLRRDASSRCCSPRCSPTSSAARSPAASQSYLPLIIPGILAQTVLTACMATGIQLREDMDKGVFDRFKSLPIARIAPLAGPMVADLLRYVIAATLTFVTGHRDGLPPRRRRRSACSAAIAAGDLRRLVAGVDLHLGRHDRPQRPGVQGISMMIMFPLTFLSNAFVPVDTLPGWLQTFVKINPVSHVVSAMRDLANDGAVTAEVGWALLGVRRRDGGLRAAGGAQLQAAPLAGGAARRGRAPRRAAPAAAGRRARRAARRSGPGRAPRPAARSAPTPSSGIIRL